MALRLVLWFSSEPATPWHHGIVGDGKRDLCNKTCNPCNLWREQTLPHLLLFTPATHGIMASSATERGRRRGGISATPATHAENKPFLFFFSSPLQPLQIKLLFTRSLGSGSAPPPPPSSTNFSFSASARHDSLWALD
uniref:Uncharacterized protein n=1 Tax=Nelumbo nucifera TaxID=4432 RepID=A0A822YGV2_NELNU|nr:TPA_asm: hypothetical protein HUJ06_009552 [Nelumbo nucifera]